MYHHLNRQLGGRRWSKVTSRINVVPATVDTGVVVVLLLYATANTDEGTDILKIDCAGVLDGCNGPARGVGIAPHFPSIDSDKPVMKLVRTVVHQGDIADDNTPRAVNVDAPKGFDGKGGKPITIKCRVHPVFLRDKENSIARLDDTGGHSGRINVLDDTGCLL